MRRWKSVWPASNNPATQINCGSEPARDGGVSVSNAMLELMQPLSRAGSLRQLLRSACLLAVPIIHAVRRPGDGDEARGIALGVDLEVVHHRVLAGIRVLANLG